jgi:hypothetical protein
LGRLEVFVGRAFGKRKEAASQIRALLPSDALALGHIEQGDRYDAHRIMDRLDVRLRG